MNKFFNGFTGLIVFFVLQCFTAGCYHSASFHSADPNGNTDSRSSSGPFSNEMNSETKRLSMMDACLNKVGSHSNAIEICEKVVARAMPGAYIVTQDWTTVPNPH